MSGRVRTAAKVCLGAILNNVPKVSEDGCAYETTAILLEEYSAVVRSGRGDTDIGTCQLGTDENVSVACHIRSAPKPLTPRCNKLKRYIPRGVQQQPRVIQDFHLPLVWISHDKRNNRQEQEWFVKK